MVAFIEACRDQFGVEPVCRALRQAGVAISPSGYYAARARPPPARAVRDAALEKEILRVYKDSGERYGAWKVWDQLNREGIAAARCTVERLMRKLGLRGVRRGGWKKPRTTVADPSQHRPADLVNRDFAPGAPDRLWVVDFTFAGTPDPPAQARARAASTGVCAWGRRLTLAARLKRHDERQPRLGELTAEPVLVAAGAARGHRTEHEPRGPG